MTDGNVLVHDTRTGKLLERGGTGQPGTDISPFLQYGNVADGDFDDARGIAYVADGDGGPNNRIVGKCCCSHFARKGASLTVAATQRWTRASASTTRRRCDGWRGTARRRRRTRTSRHRTPVDADTCSN